MNSSEEGTSARQYQHDDDDNERPKKMPRSTYCGGGSDSVDQNSNVHYPKAAVLQKCKEVLAQPDSIMDPNILLNLKNYIQAGGRPENVIELLSTSYRGYAEMVNLICSNWLPLCGFSEEDISKLVVDHLKGVIQDNFNPKKADEIFSAGASRAPKWLEFMISSPEWRRLIYHLSEKNKDCLMLNFAIQKISEAGHQDEIATVTSAATFFRVFHRVFTDSLDHLMTYNEQTLQEPMAVTTKMCSHCEYTYLYAQCILNALSETCERPEDRGIFKRLSEELEKSTTAEQRTSEDFIRKIGFFFKGWGEAGSMNLNLISSAVTSMLSAQSVNPTDIVKLHNLYTSASPPPVEFIQHPELLGLFISDLFGSSSKIGNPALKKKFIYILAYAVTQSSTSTDANESKKDLQQTISAIESALTIFSGDTFHSDLTTSAAVQTSVSELRQFLGFPVVSMGIIEWTRTRFKDPQYFNSTYNIKNTKVYLDLLKEIAVTHKYQRFAVFNLIGDLFRNMEADLDALQVIEIKRTYLDGLLYLMSLGFVLPILDKVNEWSGDMDQALLRHFIIKLVDMIEPPYSPEFLTHLVRLLCAPRTRDSLSKIKSKSMNAFIEYALSSPELKEEQQKVLRELLVTINEGQPVETSLVEGAVGGGSDVH